MARTRISLSQRLDTEIDIEAPPAPDDAGSQSASGQVTGSWTTIAGAWAEIIPDSGTVELVGNEQVAVRLFHVTIRRRDDLLPTYRFRVKNGYLAGALLNIKVFARAERDEAMSILCRQGVPN